VHDVLRELAGSGDSPGAIAEALRAAGHHLPGDLVVEAVASFADTAPTAVAEHLSPFTTAYGPEGLVDPADLDAAEMLPDGLALLASAPAVGTSSDGDALPGGDTRLDDPAGPEEALAFGAGAGTRDDDTMVSDGLAVDELAGEDPASADLTDLPSLPHDSDGFVPGGLDAQAPDDAFDPADLDTDDDAPL